MDFKPLVDKLKARGLDASEELAKGVIADVLAFAKDYVVASPNKFDDLLVVAMPEIEKQLLSIADKIDGQVG